MGLVYAGSTAMRPNIDKSNKISLYILYAHCKRPCGPYVANQCIRHLVRQSDMAIRANTSPPCTTEDTKETTFLFTLVPSSVHNSSERECGLHGAMGLLPDHLLYIG